MLLLGSPMLMDCTPTNSMQVKNNVVLCPQQEVTRPKARFIPTLPEKFGGSNQVATYLGRSWSVALLVLHMNLVDFLPYGPNNSILSHIIVKSNKNILANSNSDSLRLLDYNFLPQMVDLSKPVP